MYLLDESQKQFTNIFKIVVRISDRKSYLIRSGFNSQRQKSRDKRRTRNYYNRTDDILFVINSRGRPFLRRVHVAGLRFLQY